MTDEARDTFRQEAQDLLEQIEQGLLDLEHRPGDRVLVDSVFRGLHTLKGSGAMFGFDALAAFTHHCETAFDRVRKGEAPATPELVAAVLAAQDHMRALAEERDAPAAAGEALLARLQRATAIDAGSPAAAAVPDASTPAAQAAPSGETTWDIRFSLPVDALANGTRPLPMLDELRELGACQVRVATEAVPPLEALNPADCHLAWSVRLTTTHPRSAIEDVFIFVIDDMTLDIEKVSPDAAPAPEAAATGAETTGPETPRAAAIRLEADGPETIRLKEPKPQAAASHPVAEPQPAAAAETTGGESKTVRATENVRVPAERLDALMDRVGELVIAQSRLKQLAAASADTALRSVSEEIERLAGELRDTMMVVRMVPVIQLFGRFRRLIHDLARDTGKAIALNTVGEATELDKTVIERLADPLVHLIRNAADHGLETEAERLAAGKPATGQVTLAARQSGAEVVITISDDGRGVDRARVRAKAEDAGLVTPGAALSDAELLQLIFQPGFSTAAAVTNLSGRGVGMDVVKRAIEALRGSIEMQSRAGLGSEITLRIPLTLAIIDGLLVRVGGARYVIPLASVQECLELSPAQDARSTGRSLLTVRDRLIPFLRLRELFKSVAPPDLHQKVVVVATGAERVGLVVDQILGDHQTVIKSLSALHEDVEGFSGATILGDGGVALILDVAHLVAAGQQQTAPLRAAG